jgi:hypothetical protein
MSVLAVSAFTQAVYGFEKCNSKVMMGEWFLDVVV